MNCPNCDKEIVQTPKKRTKHFCNNTCRSNFWQKEQRKKKTDQAFAPRFESHSFQTGKTTRSTQAPEPVTISKPPAGLKGIDLTIWKQEQKEKK